jgi:hypothetical protein
MILIRLDKGEEKINKLEDKPEKIAQNMTWSQRWIL